jgi:hypothetical protein
VVTKPLDYLEWRDYKNMWKGGIYSFIMGGGALGVIGGTPWSWVLFFFGGFVSGWVWGIFYVLMLNDRIVPLIPRYKVTSYWASITPPLPTTLTIDLKTSKTQTKRVRLPGDVRPALMLLYENCTPPDGDPKKVSKEKSGIRKYSTYRKTIKWLKTNNLGGWNSKYTHNQGANINPTGIIILERLYNLPHNRGKGWVN